MKTNNHMLNLTKYNRYQEVVAAGGSQSECTREGTYEGDVIVEGKQAVRAARQTREPLLATGGADTRGPSPR